MVFAACQVHACTMELRVGMISSTSPPSLGGGSSMAEKSLSSPPQEDLLDPHCP